MGETELEENLTPYIDQRNQVETDESSEAIVKLDDVEKEPYIRPFISQTTIKDLVEDSGLCADCGACACDVSEPW